MKKLQQSAQCPALQHRQVRATYLSSWRRKLLLRIVVLSLAEHGPDGPHDAVQVGLHATLAALHPHSSRLAPDEDGLLPEWLVFNSLVATARNFLVKVPP